MAQTDYSYIRDLVSGTWDIDNPARIDGAGEQIHLATEIEIALPGKVFTVRCAATECVIRMSAALTAGDKTTLDTVVADHKNNV